MRDRGTRTERPLLWTLEYMLGFGFFLIVSPPTSHVAVPGNAVLLLFHVDTFPPGFPF